MGERVVALPTPRPASIEDLIVNAAVAAVAAAIERAEQRGEDRARAQRTHLSIREAADAVGVSERHLRTLIDDGTIPSLTLGRRVVVPRRALEELGC